MPVLVASIVVAAIAVPRGWRSTVVRLDCAAQTYDPAMTIVPIARPKRPAKPAQAATIKVPRIVQHTPKGRLEVAA